jgi:outer membrane lipopolysaccharide assembly protein LptE/RlpB
VFTGGFMKNLLMLTMLFLAGCGYDARNNEMMGQVKKIINETPLLCSDFTTADVSLGVMRNGVGSMSSEDIMVLVPESNAEALKTLKGAAESGQLVKITYDSKRTAFCTPHRVVIKAELVK